MSEEIEAVYIEPDAELEKMFSEIPAGHKVQIERVEPDWCKGIEGTYPVAPDDNISTEWLRKKFGGRKLRVRWFDEKMQYKGMRTIEFSSPPLRDGAPIQPGPHGSAILCSEATVHEPARRDDSSDKMVNVLETMLKMQTAQAESMLKLQTQQSDQMIKMLTNRLEGVEKILTDKMTGTEPAQTVATTTPAGPQDQLKTTLETVRMIDELRGAVGGAGESTSESIFDSPVAKELMGKLAERIVDPPKQQVQPQPHYQQQQIPAPEPSNFELATMVKERMGDMPEEERNFLLSHVFGTEEEEPPAIAGQEDFGEVQSLLTPEDSELINDETSDQNDGEEIPPRDDPPVAEIHDQINR